MELSDRTIVILIISFIVLLILLGVWVIKTIRHFRVEERNYEIDSDLGDEIEAVVKSNDEWLNEIKVNEIETHRQIFGNVEEYANVMMQ